MNRVKIVGASVLLLLVLVLMIQNRASVKTQLLFAEVEMPQSILLLTTAVLGFGAGGLVTWFALRRKKERKPDKAPATGHPAPPAA
ncbi:MAG: LapA family protein [Verrucomicrobiales bacterium]|nr:LapA family protein [Verrucomicrobiales bacterium]MCP5526795.1 LapA family protein [Verrucomicrobiales bacterium]